MSDFVSVLGGVNSQLGNIALGYETSDYAVATWIGQKTPDNGIQEVDFGLDESGTPIKLVKNVPTVISRTGLAAARSFGLIIVALEPTPTPTFVPIPRTRAREELFGTMFDADFPWWNSGPITAISP